MEETLRECEDSVHVMPLDARSFFMNIGKTENGCFYGNVSQLFYKEDCCFCGLDSAVLKIDKMINERTCAALSSKEKEFPEKQGQDLSNLTAEKPTAPEKRKNMQSFLIDVMYRQHSSWQGRVTWLHTSDAPEKAYFRSVLELLGLIQSSFEKEA